MRDPERVSRAQRAAARLEGAWERWRTRHGLGGVLCQPVASYVGYAPEEPRGRPRVVFGVDAVEAERLALLLDADALSGVEARSGLDARDDAGARSGADTRSVADTGSGGFSDPRADRADDPVGDPCTGAASQPCAEPQLLVVRASGDAQESGTAPAAAPGGASVPITAELAGWATSELPGHASAGLAAWAAAEQERSAESARSPSPRNSAGVERENRAGPLAWPA